MPPRDEQDFEQRRQQIIDGALEAFAAKGFEGASNKDIAEAAGIGSPGLIYHYFKDKVDLLHQMILARMPMVALIDEVHGLLDANPPPDAFLPELCVRVVRTMETGLTVALMRVVIAEAIRNRRVAQVVNDVGPGRALVMLAGYLQSQMDAGRLRRMDPHVAARLLIGPIAVYTLTRVIFEMPESMAIDGEVMARATAESFLRSMAP